MKPKSVDITPDKSLIKKLGRTGYRTEQAVAELIDNAIDARIEGKKQNIDVKLDFEMRQITVSDNGRGMDTGELTNALTIAKETKNDDKLGEFGLGMKSACSALGKSFTLSTAKKNSVLRFVAKYDEDEWLNNKSRNWKNFEISQAKNDSKHGTSIRISKLKVPLYPNQAAKFRRRFGIRYSTYLKSNQMNITVNSKECKPVKFILEKNTRQKISISLSMNNKITGWIGLLEKRSIKGDYGLHLYKKGRLIKAFDKFGIRHHPTVARIIGELALDHVPVNFHKTGFLEDSLEYKEAVMKFRDDPTIKNVIKSMSVLKRDPSRIKEIFEYDQNSKQRPIDTRMSAANARSMLHRADSFTVQAGSLALDVEFKNEAGVIYHMNPSNNGARISINRSSESLKVFKNPLFLMGLIRIEAELAAEDPSKHAAFINERNRRWDEFVKTSLEKPGMIINRSKEAEPLRHYSLEKNLIDLHDHLKENFMHDFQFTGMSMLVPFLHNAYNRVIYNIQTINGAGQELVENIRENTRFIALLNPKRQEVYTVLETSSESVIIVIREYDQKLPTTWAMPEKAWLDLFVETDKNSITFYEGELETILEGLQAYNLINLEKLYSLAKHRKIMEKIKMYVEGFQVNA